MTYDTWKATNPDDEFLGPEPEEEWEPEVYPVGCDDLVFLTVGLGGGLGSFDARGRWWTETAIEQRRATEERRYIANSFWGRLAKEDGR